MDTRQEATGFIRFAGTTTGTVSIGDRRGYISVDLGDADDDDEVYVHPVSDEHPRGCVQVFIGRILPVSVYGTPERVRRLAEAMLADLPAEVEA